MSTSDLCYICGEKSTNRCDSCGGAVCNEHYDAPSGLCVKCKRGRTMEDS